MADSTVDGSCAVSPASLGVPAPVQSARQRRRRQWSRQWRRRLAVVAASAAILVASAAPASAHAVLQGSDPAGGATLEAAPAAVTLTFSEGVSVEDDAVRVIDTGGERVDAGDARSGESGSQVVVGLDGDLAQGT
nr:copper resistance protein CopC [Micromonospora sp. DSM 115978]